MNQKRLQLDDIRQIGPHSERDISGVCSACRATLLTRINSVKVPTRAELESALQRLFDRHVTEEHSDSGRQDAAL